MSGATSPTSVSAPEVPPTVPKLLPVLKRSLSSQGTSEPVVPPTVPKLLPVKRSNSSQGLPDPVVSPVTSSPPPVQVKQEKPESPLEYSPCQESLKKVWWGVTLSEIHLLCKLFHHSLLQEMDNRKCSL